MKKLVLALFTLTSTVAYMSACSPSERNEDDEDSNEGGAGGDDEKGGTGGSSRSGGSGGKSGGSGGTSSGGTGGTSSGGTGGTTSGGSGGTTSGGSGGSGGGGSGGTTVMGTLTGNPMPGPYEMPFDIFIDPGTFTMGMGIKTFDGGNTCCIGGVDEGDWAKHEAINFGDHCAYDKVTVRYSSPNNGGFVEFHANALNGPIIAKVNLTATGMDFGTQGMAEAAVMPVSGTHEIFVRFGGVSFGVGNFLKYVFTASGMRMKCP